MEIVDLPPLKRGIEWPTVALAFAIYGLWFIGDFFPPRSAVVGPDRAGRVDHHMATEPAARDHSRPSNAEPTRQRGDRLLASVALASLFDLPLHPPCPSSRRESDRSARRPGKLLLDVVGMGRTGAGLARARPCAHDPPRADHARPSLFDRRLHPRSRARRLARRTRRAPRSWRATSSCARPC